MFGLAGLRRLAWPRRPEAPRRRRAKMGLRQGISHGPEPLVGCEGCPFYKQLAATLCAKPRVTCSRRKARVWKAFVDVATQEALAWPEPLEDAFIEVLEGDQVVDGVRELWFSRNVTNETELHTDNARFKRRALTALSCNPEYGHADAKLCARAAEIGARADVERPGATKTLHFNSTLPRKHDDRDCGDALSRRADYDDLLMDRIRNCAPPPPKKLDKDDWRRRKKMRRDEAERRRSCIHGRATRGCRCCCARHDPQRRSRAQPRLGQRARGLRMAGPATTLRS